MMTPLRSRTSSTTKLLAAGVLLFAAAGVGFAPAQLALDTLRPASADAAERHIIVTRKGPWSPVVTYNTGTPTRGLFDRGRSDAPERHTVTTKKSPWSPVMRHGTDTSSRTNRGR